MSTSVKEHTSLPLLRRWESALHDLLDDTESFPKRIRYSFVARIDNHALEILEQLQVARYATQHRELEALKVADQSLAKLKVSWPIMDLKPRHLPVRVGPQ